jgi:hypothetical protein
LDTISFLGQSSKAALLQTQRTLISTSHWLPFTQTATEKDPFISTDFNILKQAIDLISEDFERYLLASLIDVISW